MRFFLELVGGLVLLVFLVVMGYGAWENAHKPTPTWPIACRLPDIETEYRIVIQERDRDGVLHETCSIEPRDPLEGRFKTLQRLLKRAQKK